MAKRATLLTILLAIAAAHVGCATEPPTSEKELSGTIRDRLSGKRISKVTVTFTSDTLYRESTSTDDDGHYEMVVSTDTALGQVRAERSGYEPAETTVFFDAPQRTINLELLPSPTP